MGDEPNTQWPPKPISAVDPKAVAEVPTCPSCKRKLLTIRSIMCNWCGAVITNDEYQQRAADERAAMDASVKRQLEIEQQETARLGVIGRLKKIKKEGRVTESLTDLLKPD